MPLPRPTTGYWLEVEVPARATAEVYVGRGAPRPFWLGRFVPVGFDIPYPYTMPHEAPHAARVRGYTFIATRLT